MGGGGGHPLAGTSTVLNGDRHLYFDSLRASGSRLNFPRRRIWNEIASLDRNSNVVNPFARVGTSAHAGPTPCTGTFESSLDFGDTVLNGFNGPFGQLCITLTNWTTAAVTLRAA